LTDGKAGTIDHVFLDDLHGLRISIRRTRGQTADLDGEARRERNRSCSELIPRRPGGEHAGDTIIAIRVFRTAVVAPLFLRLCLTLPPAPIVVILAGDRRERVKKPPSWPWN
jgi:hypothetical protein